MPLLLPTKQQAEIQYIADMKIEGRTGETYYYYPGGVEELGYRPGIWSGGTIKENNTNVRKKEEAGERY